MAEYHSRLGQFYLAKYNLTGQSSNVDVTQEAATADVSGFGDSATSHVAGLNSWSARVSSFWNDTSTTGVAAVYNTAFAASGIVSLWPGGATLGYRGYAAPTVDETSWNITSAIGNAAVTEAGLSGNGLLDHVLCYGASTSTMTGSYAHTSHNFSGSHASALMRGYLHVTAVTGSPTTIKFQESADDSAWSDLASMAFTQIASSATSESITATGSHAQYVRLYRSAGSDVSTITYVAAFYCPTQ